MQTTYCSPDATQILDARHPVFCVVSHTHGGAWHGRDGDQRQAQGFFGASAPCVSAVDADREHAGWPAADGRVLMRLAAPEARGLSGFQIEYVRADAQAQAT